MPPLTPSAWALLLAGVVLVAALYGSVGHGGASGYLALMVLASVPAEAMKGTALLLNLLVAGCAWGQFGRAGHFVPRLFWPFAAASVPAAYVGSGLAVPVLLFEALLALALVAAGLRMLFPPRAADAATRRPAIGTSLALGAGIGLVSGIIGVGGGIFLSPLLILAGWATMREAAAVSSAFIVLNSAAGLLGHLRGHVLPLELAGALLLAAGAGGALGSFWGARRASPAVLGRLLGVVLLLASGKLAAVLLGRL